MRCWNCGTSEGRVLWYPWRENHRDIALCEKCSWEYFLKNVNPLTLSDRDKVFVIKEKKKMEA